MPSSIFYPTDAISGARVIIDEVHHETHGGNHYTISHVETSAGTGVTVMITTPAGGQLHMTFQIVSSAAGSWIFSEAPGASAGTALSVINNKRDSSNTSGAVVKWAVTWATSGTVLQKGTIGAAGIPVNEAGGTGEPRNEWLLASSQTYLIRIVPSAASTITVGVGFYKEA